MMYIYLIHFHSKVGRPQSVKQRAEHGLPPRAKAYVPHAHHYIGCTDNLVERLERHKKGNGAHIIRTANHAGIRWHLARIWVGDWELERALKAKHNAPKLCPVCQADKIRRRLER